MANNKKKNNRRSSSRPQGAGSRQTASVTVRERKKQLIRERIHKNEEKSRGMRSMGIIAATIMLSRAALFVYELAYFTATDAKINAVSNLLLLPLLLIVYMAHDGNRGLLGVTAISAATRVLFLFVSMYPEIEGKIGAPVFIGVYLTVMAAQFIMSVAAISMPKIGAYCEEMRKINTELRMNLMNGR